MGTRNLILAAIFGVVTGTTALADPEGSKSKPSVKSQKENRYMVLYRKLDKDTANKPVRWQRVNGLTQPAAAEKAKELEKKGFTTQVRMERPVPNRVSGQNYKLLYRKSSDDNSVKWKTISHLSHTQAKSREKELHDKGFKTRIVSERATNRN